MKKNIKFFFIVAMLILTIGRVSAETISDEANDVLHAEWKLSLQGYAYTKAISDKPDVDITKITYEISGQQLLLSLDVKGKIQDASNVVYSLYYNTTSATYEVHYAYGTGYCIGSSLDGTDYSEGNVTALGNTLTAFTKPIGNGTTVKFWGFAATGDSIGQTGGEWWGDWAPEDFAPTIDSGNGGDNDDSTPGFEFMLTFSALAMIVFIYKQKHP